jgi:hypothetical protein
MPWKGLPWLRLQPYLQRRTDREWQRQSRCCWERSRSRNTCCVHRQQQQQPGARGYLIDSLTDTTDTIKAQQLHHTVARHIVYSQSTCWTCSAVKVVIHAALLRRWNAIATVSNTDANQAATAFHAVGAIGGRLTAAAAAAAA